MNFKYVFFGLMSMLSVAVLAQVPYVFSYNPGPNRGTKWMAKASDGQTESSVAVLMSAPRAVWARVCYSIGPSESSVTVYTQTRNEAIHSSEITWGGCTDVFGTNIWIGNPHGQTVGGYYGIAPATPGD
ncbi:hypothetical protein [Roseateles sp.]|uniref:hypothetical protein n=1 Tax=Roseateles sp. TaxID=1971397 RepID=UPI0039E94661